MALHSKDSHVADDVAKHITAEADQNALLQGVARTFALTIPQLPAPLAKVVSNAYLLCRITDTIEDEVDISDDTRHSLAQEFIQVVAGEAPAEHFAQRFYPLLSEQRLAAEKRLIQETAAVIRITHGFTVPQQQALLKCVRVMAEGMVYYRANSSPVGFESLNQLDNYCYHVAGVVGEMLTELYCDYCPAMAEQKAQLMRLAVSFGQGLQMTNILKDIWEDYQRGVCWLPQDVFNQAGFDLSRLSNAQYKQQQQAAFAKGLRMLIAIAVGHLKNALEYSILVPAKEVGLRKFCLWAIWMALLTLCKINAQPNFSAASQVKIKKLSVLAVIALTSITKRYNGVIRRIFALLAKPLPGRSEGVSTSNSHDRIRDWFNARSG